MGSVRFEKTVSVQAPVEVLWEVVENVEAWPTLTESMTSVERLDGGPLRVGMRVRVHQPKLPPATWKVTELVVNERFVWKARGLGFSTQGFHAVAPDGEGSTLTLAIEQSGLMSGLVGRMWKDLTENYIALEAAGIKHRAEGDIPQ